VPDEGGEQPCRHDEAQQRARRRPAVPGRLDDRVDQDAEAERREQQARHVDARRLGVAALGHEQHDQGDRQQRDGQLGQERAAPPELLEQSPAGDGPEGDRQPGAGAPQPDRLGPRRPLAEHLREDRQGGREDGRRADAGEGARGDQLAGRVGERGQRVPQAEDRQPDEQDRPSAQPVGQAAAGQHEGGEHQQVAVDDPLQVARGGAELGHERRQRDVHDRGVDVDGEHGQAHHGEHRPRARADGRRHAVLPMFTVSTSGRW
jgi:hypothetical protein